MDSQTKNQKERWDDIHKNSSFRAYTKIESNYAAQVMKQLTPGMKMLDIGTGCGNDAVFFAKNKLGVIATDFSHEAITQNISKYKNIEGLEFLELETEKIGSLGSKKFDVVYARLSLHYFGKETVKKIMQSIHQLLKKDGKLFFTCKSTEDKKYGEGTQISNNMYLSPSGHIRHFFDKEYTQELLAGIFKIEALEVKKGVLYGKENSSWIEVFGTKIQ